MKIRLVLVVSVALP